MASTIFLEINPKALPLAFGSLVSDEAIEVDPKLLNNFSKWEDPISTKARRVKNPRSMKVVSPVPPQTRKFYT